MVNPSYILAVDDDREFLEILKDKLGAFGFKIETACDGDEAIEKINNKIPALVLMDVQMPNKDGIDTTQEIHANPKTADLKVMFLTSLGTSSADLDTHFAKQVGAVDFFKKGADLDTLVEKIKALL